MHLYKTDSGLLLKYNGQHYAVNSGFDDLVNRVKLHDFLLTALNSFQLITEGTASEWLKSVKAPIGTQEVWAAGVTYLRSRDARMEESKESGAASFYDKVYDAERPELFFKSFPQRVSGHDQEVYIRKDSSWNVPEPELALFISSKGTIEGYTIGNDMSSRSIEGENPLYLPQAKVYEKSAALGPCLYIPKEPIPTNTTIHLTIERSGKIAFEDSVQISRIRRAFGELVNYLYDGCDFAHGCFLMTGTCLVPPDHFTLDQGDIVTINISNIGTMVNRVSWKPLRQQSIA